MEMHSLHPESYMNTKKEYPVRLFDEIQEFIDDCLFILNRRNYKPEIIILLPNHYKFILNRYFAELKTLIPMRIDENKDEITWQGHRMLFLSPDNKLYVYQKNFQLAIPEKWNELKFEIQLP